MPEPKLPPNESTFLTDVKSMFVMTPGDWGCLCQLFFDNLSTLLGALFAIQGLANLGDISADLDVVNYYIFGKIVPGVGVTLLIGNIYYSWQACRLTNRWGRQYTAQPYGLNTPAAFSFVFNIMCKSRVGSFRMKMRCNHSAHLPCFLPSFRSRLFQPGVH